MRRLIRYLAGTEEVGLLLPARGTDAGARELQIFSDADWAGESGQRKSVSCGAIMLQGGLLYSYSRRQGVVAQSSGEAEYYAAATAASEGVLVAKVLNFVGVPLDPVLFLDSSAAIGICRRMGVGKARHLETKVLWLQQLVKDQALKVRKCAGVSNPADIGTKILDKTALTHCLDLLGARGHREESEVRHARHGGAVRAEDAGRLFAAAFAAMMMGTRADTLEQQAETQVSRAMNLSLIHI